MNYQFETYKPRKIEFQQTITINAWKVKVYSITINTDFQSPKILENTLKQLPIWIDKAKNSELPTYNTAFLIIHEAREGVWILFNWWTGGEMIETKVYFSNYDTLSEIKDTPHKNSLVCVWELEVFAHERKKWIEYILLNAEHPNFKEYLNDVLQ